MAINRVFAIFIILLVFILIITVAVHLLPYVLIAIIIFWIWGKWKKTLYPWLKNKFQRRRGAHGTYGRTREVVNKNQKRIIDI